MTRDEIIKLAREAKVFIPRGLQEAVAIQELQRFAALVEAAEREQCALAAWEIVQYEVHADLADQVAQAIRARGNA